MLEGETDTKGIAMVLNAMNLAGENLQNEVYEVRKGDSTPCEVERVLRLASAVSVDFLQQFVLKWPYATLVVQVAPALLDLITGTEGALRHVFRPVVDAMMVKIEGEIPAVRHRSYERLWFECPDTESRQCYGHYMPPFSREPCESCTKLKEFVKSPTEQTMTFNSSRDVHAVNTVKQLTVDRSDGKFVVSKTYDNPLVVKGRAVIDRLKTVLE